MTIIDKRRGFGEGADAAQQAAQRAIDTNVPNHIKTGVLLQGITIGAGASVATPHKLERVPTGWQKMRTTGSGAGGDLVEVSADRNTITFKRNGIGATGSLTFDIWVF